MKIISRTPVRINLANGGDTDYYLKEIGWGCVINATLSSHFYEVELNEENDFKLDVVDYFDYVNNMNRSYKLHLDFSELDLIKAALNELNFEGKNSYVIRTNVPMQSGLGGSSSVAVALISAIKHYRNESSEPSTIAESAYNLERNGLKVPGGYQDQYAAAHGQGLNYMEFRPGTVKVQPLKISENTLKKLEKEILLYYLSKRHVSGSDVHNAQESSAKNDPETIKKILIEKRDNALKIKAALEKGELEEFGRLLRIDGELKNKLSNKYSNPQTNAIMKSAFEAGALGGKISGAGGGGCIMFYVPENSISKVKKVLSSHNAIEMNFRFQRDFEPGIMIREIK